jgi:hypothetical protein
MIPDHRDAGHIEADVPAMAEIAGQLSTVVERDYAPRAVTVSQVLLTRVPAADRSFSELGLFLHAHEQAQDAMLGNVHHYANGTFGLAEAAREAGRRYSESDTRAGAALIRAAAEHDT